MTAQSIHRTEKKESHIKSFCSSVVVVAIFDIVCCHNEEETRLKAEENVLQVRDIRNSICLIYQTRNEITRLPNFIIGFLE